MKKLDSVIDQPSLFGDTVVKSDAAVPNGGGFSDPSFAVNKEIPIHRWVPWIAGFSRNFVSDALSRYLSKPGTVLDPFAGVGTTLVESILAGHDVIGFEINPYAAMACRLKLMAHRVNTEKLRAAIRDFEVFYDHASQNEYRPFSTPPQGFSTRSAFYSPKVLYKVLILQDFLAKNVAGTVRDLFSLAFASTMVSYSNYSYEPSLSRRVTGGKRDIFDFPVGEAITAKLRQMSKDIDWMRDQVGTNAINSRIYNTSFFNCRQHLDSGVVDLMITSPPYLNNYHYNRNTRPHLYWLGFTNAPKDFRPLEQDNFGKYWQTVRELDRLVLDFPNPDAELVRSLELVRAQKPEKGIYGGNGWANYAAAYFNDCYRFLKCAKWTLRRRGTALIVIGNNILQGVMIPTDRYLAKIAESIGLEVVDIHIPRATRIGNSIIQSGVRVGKAKSSDSLYEAVVELRKR